VVSPYEYPDEWWNYYSGPDASHEFEVTSVALGKDSSLSPKAWGAGLSGNLS